MHLLQKLSEITADPLMDFSSQGPISRSAVDRCIRPLLTCSFSNSVF